MYIYITVPIVPLYMYIRALRAREKKIYIFSSHFIACSSAQKRWHSGTGWARRSVAGAEATYRQRKECRVLLGSAAGICPCFEGANDSSPKKALSGWTSTHWAKNRKNAHGGAER